MESIKIIIKDELETTNCFKSKLFGSASISEKDIKTINDKLFLLAQIKLSELPKNGILPDEGILYFFISEDGNIGKVIYSLDFDLSKDFYKISNFKSFSIEFIKERRAEGLKMLGKPLELNKDFPSDEVLLLQYDPYEDNRLEFLSTIDGVVYFSIKKRDLKRKRFDKAFVTKDFT
ncbi:MAG: DUF1963 domain-containing protein [Candidatus Izemoplasmatales bacterium]|jgi:uncharacterized protein YwqG